MDRPRVLSPSRLAEDDWLAAATAYLLTGIEDDDDDEEPDDEPDDDEPEVSPFRRAHLPEYARRVLGMYRACGGWSHAAVAPLWPWLDYTSACFEREDLAGWRAGLAELERYLGIAPAAPEETG